ncbi:sensor histidine kinase [Nocardia seriolae]|uniref:histidine kinase n=1 Tax=Nocardia seriolae TaxID=37332 RepID=A0A0B8NCI0_9NOCA|nr:PAS domain-containing sensor histidine kinase [Nocardia seriolae]APA96166.1 Phytochrome-like protein cph1 [Nocardia seriolae]MTJ65757.1 PAS domain S-box protein [Nocardia seriolae]MTJ75136.1 PAS domain S-box protein [Nocardia seriolae]MTJ86310.1 PAS domain S-box protein [Nocardia seriolae]MTK30306.1 PAS domain S-box protein [Nocardia seriolae]
MESQLALLAALIESSDDAILSKTLDGRITSWNPAATRMYGYTPEEIIGKSVSLLIAADNPGEMQSILTRIREGKRVDHYETLRIRKDGTAIDVSLTVSPIKDADSTVIGASSIARDITERRIMERLERDRLERSNAELETFAYAASHDLQEPLRMIINYTQLLARHCGGRLDADADAYLGFTLDAATRMRALIDDLLDYSRVTSADLDPGPTDGERALAHALADLTVLRANTGAVVTHDPLPTLPADAGQLVRLLENLVSNAIKFSGDHTPVVHLGAQRIGDQWRLFVRDNGIGIEAAQCERVFDAFQRLDPQRYPGTGLGLAIAKRIVERHRGQIWVESARGQGSTFYFTIPDRAGPEEDSP